LLDARVFDRSRRAGGAYTPRLASMEGESLNLSRARFGPVTELGCAMLNSWSAVEVCWRRRDIRFEPDMS
jgi:hypothetical protein